MRDRDSKHQISKFCQPPTFNKQKTTLCIALKAYVFFRDWIWNKTQAIHPLQMGLTTPRYRKLCCVDRMPTTHPCDRALYFRGCSIRRHVPFKHQIFYFWSNFRRFVNLLEFLCFLFLTKSLITYYGNNINI